MFLNFHFKNQKWHLHFAGASWDNEREEDTFLPQPMNHTTIVIKLFDSSLPVPKHKDENASFSSFFSSFINILLWLLPSPSTFALALGGTFFFRCSKWKGNPVTLLWKFMPLLCWFHSEPSCEALPNGSHIHCKPQIGPLGQC